ncbi:MAG: arginine decarboxylase, partial [Aeromonadaceae bacterium]
DICLDEHGKPVISHIIRGDTVDNLLRYVNINPERIRENYEALVANPSLDAETRAALLADLDAGLHGYAYLEDDE